jgi:LmbE family N-acetylglucosaminyl deacetylase
MVRSGAPLSRPSRGTLLGVWAHPDDEAYLSAGLMAAARDAGWRVVVATATWGESGTADPERWPRERLAALRRRELRDSLAAVGVTEHRHLGHRDGSCAEADEAAATGGVLRVMEEVRPDVLVTFGPDGMTGHPDHRAVSAWTTAAWEQTGRGSRLWYATVTPSFHEHWGRVNERVGLWMAPDRPCTPEAALAHTTACAGSVLARKRAALAAHRSQVAPLVALIGPDAFDAWWATEYFVSAERICSGRAAA